MGVFEFRNGYLPRMLPNDLVTQTILVEEVLLIEFSWRVSTKVRR